jgi:DNA-binding response OmpR family regulator
MLYSSAGWDSGLGKQMHERRLPRILIVDDQSSTAGAYRGVLEKNGFEVVVAPTGGEALSMAVSGWPHLVLLDLTLPDIDGLTVLERMRKDGRSASLAVIILSNEESPSLMHGAFELGALDYMRKSRVTSEAVALRVKAWARVMSRSGVADHSVPAAL